MEENLQKEQFSRAYIEAVAAVAGFNTYGQKIDDDSIDIGVAARGPFGVFVAPRVEFQLKCTARPKWLSGQLHYPLKLKNYIDLSGDRTMVPRLLAVMIVPERLDEWLTQSIDELLMRRSCYWVSLRTATRVPNLTKVTVSIPQSQLLTVEALRHIVAAVGKGSPP